MWILIVGYILFIYLITNLITPRFLDGFTDAYIVRPALWMLLFSLSIYIGRKEGLNIWLSRRVRLSEDPVLIAFLTGAFQVSMLSVAGIFYGFGRSPYLFTPISILINAVFILSFIFGTEFSRTLLIRYIPRRSSLSPLILVALFFTLIQINLGKFLSVNTHSILSILEFLGGEILPSFTIGLFASYLAYVRGTSASIPYILVVTGFEWFSPVLPNLGWVSRSFIEVISPSIGFLLLQPRPRRKRTRSFLPKSVGATIVVTFFIFFSLGYLGVKPTVIISGSMRPTLDVGDLVIIERVDSSKIRKGDIIEYRVGRMSIVHRVVEIKKEGFVTKGDANRYPDPDPVHPDQIRGKVIFTVPKIGWIPLILKELIHRMVKMG